MRDIFVTVIVLGSIPLILARPHFGILMWAWLGFMNPHRLTWGFALSVPFAQIVAIATLIGMFFSRERKRIPWTRETFVLLLFIAWMLITTLFAFNPEGAWLQLQKVGKIQIMILVTLVLMLRVERLQSLIWVIVLSLGFYGVKGGIWTVATGGTYRVYGPDGTFIGGNNEIGLALIMVIPLMRYLQLTSKRRWVRMGLTAAMALSAISILGTQSRGAFVGIAAMLFFLVLKSRKRFALTIVLVLVIPLGLLVMPQKWFDRMNTIRTYEQDGSAMGRINAWTFAYNLAKDRPLIGGGFETFRVSYLHDIYAPDPDVRDAHSIYFEVLGEHGFAGLFLFLSLGFLVWRSCSAVKKQARGHPELGNFSDLATMTQVSLVGYATSGAFLGLAYFDLYYNLVAIVILAKMIVREHLEEMAAEFEDGQAPASYQVTSSEGAVAK